MYRAVLEICKKHEQNWNGIPGFVTSVNELESTLIKLEKQAQMQSTRTIGVSTVKSEKVEELFERLMLIQGTLEVYGKLSGNSELRLRNKINLTELSRKTISTLSVHIQNVLADIDQYGAFLEELGISPALMDEITAILVSAQHSLSRPRMAIIERKLYTSNLKELVHKVDEILKVRLDKLIRIFKKDMPEFFDLYFHARMIIDSQHVNSNTKKKKTGPPTIEPDDGFN